MGFPFTTYMDLIDYASSQERIKNNGRYYEMHHIIPKHEGGLDDDSNLVLLTLYEHTLAHYLLAMESNGRVMTANLISAQLISSYGDMCSDNCARKAAIENFLNDPKAIELLENVKKNLADLPRAWIQIGNQKPYPVAANGRRIDNMIDNGIQFKFLEVCPICNQPNSRSSFACCKEHTIEYLASLRNAVKKGQSETVAASWKNEEVANSRKKSSSISQKGIPKNIVWITNGTNNQTIKKDAEVPQGWRKGRTAEKWEYTPEQKAAAKGRNGIGIYIHKDDIVKRVKESELQSWLDNGWIKGSIDRRIHVGMPHLNRKKNTWIHKENECIMIPKEELTQYLDNGWIKGRPNSSKKVRAKQRISQAGLYWFTNGIIDKRAREQPEGFYRGRTNTFPK